eukprot:7137727-Alexandrium_andersonii.AAC.1
MIANAAKEPLNSLRSAQGSARVCGQRKKADLTQQTHGPPIPKGAERTKDVPRVAERAPRRGHRRAPGQQ